MPETKSPVPAAKRDTGDEVQQDDEQIIPTPTRRQRSCRAAINAMCRACIYDPLAGGGWRKQVGACSCLTCPLYAFRPLPRYRDTRPSVEPEKASVLPTKTAKQATIGASLR